MPVTIETIIDRLTAIPSTTRLLNIYAGPSSDGRRRNLTAYLREMVEHTPSHVFMGEAPGPHGCRLTGLPFTDPLTVHLRPIRFANGDLLRGQYWTPRNYLRFEDSCYPVWRAFQVTGRPQLLWEAVPLFPHEAGTLAAWRNVGDAEPRAFADLFVNLLELFVSVQHIVAVGAKARKFLIWMRDNQRFARLQTQYSLHEVAHPSHGHQNQFLSEGVTVIQNPAAHLI